MAIDMGGPINKAAYVTGTGLLASGEYHVMAAVMAGGMVPPLAIALCTTFFKNRFTESERKAGITNYVMGLSFITEGAIPFAAADPLRVIPSMMVGGAVTGALTMALGVGSYAPHGGVFVFFAIQNFLGFVISIIAGVTLVTSPLWGALFLWWLVGISLLVLGVINFLRGLAGSKSDRG